MLGVKEILARDPQTRPDRLARSPASLVHAATKAAPGMFYELYAKFVDGALYPTLRALEREGLVVSRTGEAAEIPARQGRPRVYYELTAEGHRAAYDERETARGLFGFPGPEPALGEP